MLGALSPEGEAGLRGPVGETNPARPPSRGRATGGRDFGANIRTKQARGVGGVILGTASGDRPGEKVLVTWECLGDGWGMAAWLPGLRPTWSVHFPEPELYSKDACGLSPSNTADLNSLLTNGKYINT